MAAGTGSRRLLHLLLVGTHQVHPQQISPYGAIWKYGGCMPRIRHREVFGWIVLLVVCFAAAACETGVELSPEPGILRVILQSDPADTTITIAGETVGVGNTANFGVRIFQGRAFRDSSFIVLLKSPDSYREEDFVYNVLAREGGDYVEYVLFESLVPPGRYDSIRFGVNAEQLVIGSFDIPVRLPEDAPPSMNFPAEFEVAEDAVTEIRVMISPLKSVERYRDSFLFRREMRVADVGVPGA